MEATEAERVDQIEMSNEIELMPIIIEKLTPIPLDATV